MLSVTDLLTITTKPRQNDIDLKTILFFYEEHLCTRKFIFELDDRDRPLVHIHFEPDQLCHLLGIHYILKGKKFSGQSGFNLIKDGTVTFEYLNKVNQTWFKSKRNRMLYFPFVYQLLQNPTVIQFSAIKANTSVDIELILYNQHDNGYLHLGISKYPNSEIYFPKSFYERNNRHHIDGQIVINIKSINIETI